MNDSATSLDRLHDLVPPPEVSWWPLAPGWYVVILLVLALLGILIARVWRTWSGNAYRRAALSELASAQDPATIAELLRRTALAVAPRSVVVEMSGAAWLDWLARHGPEAMPDAVRLQLTRGVYGRAAADPEDSLLRDYAARWIALHKPALPDGGSC